MGAFLVIVAFLIVFGIFYSRQKNRIKSTAPFPAAWKKILDEKIRAIVREEIADGAAIHEKIQGIILAMKSNLNDPEAFEDANKEEKAA